MENVKRESIVKQVFNSFKDIFIDIEEVNNGIPTMTDLNSKDWENISDAERKEILIKSPSRIKDILSNFVTRVLPKKTKSSFASGTSLSKNQNIKSSQVEKEVSDDFEIGG